MGNFDFKPVFMETIKLPSKGQIYKNIPETFEIRPMTVNEVKMLYGSGNTMRALGNILKSVISVPDFPVDELIVGDKLYLAYALRAVTFGDEFTGIGYCDKCHAEKKVKFSLMNDIKINYLPDGFTNPRSIGKLPVCGDELEIRLLTNTDLDKILTRADTIKQKFPEYVGEPIYPVSLAYQIDTVNGKKMAQSDKEQYVLKLHAVDDAYISSHLRKVEVGPVLPVELECPDCGSTIKVGIPMSEEFFRPELTFD